MSDKTIVAVQFRDRTDKEKFAGREYNYFSTVELAEGDVIMVPAAKGQATVRVSRINVRDSEVDERFLPTLRTINEVVRPESAKACRVCGCTQERACPGGCYWVEDDLCSACVASEPPERSD